MKKILLMSIIMNLSNIFCSDTSSSSCSSSSSSSSSSGSSTDSIDPYDAYVKQYNASKKCLSDINNFSIQMPPGLIAYVYFYLDPISREQWNKNNQELIDIFKLEKEITKESIKRVRELLESGADVNIKNEYGQSIVSLATDKYNDDMVELLLNYNAEVNIPNPIGTTPLMYASRGTNIRLIELLLSHKANVLSKNEHGITALSSAKEYRDGCERSFQINGYPKTQEDLIKRENIVKLLEEEIQKQNG